MNDRFERDLERVLGAGSQQVSAATRRALAARRRAVLDAAEAEPRRGWKAAVGRAVLGPDRRSWWLPAGAMAAALLAVFVIRTGTGPLPAVAETDALDMDILFAEENLEFYDDLEFFEWLAVTDDETG